MIFFNSFEFEINLITINFIRKLIRNLNFECGTAKLAKKFQVHKITVPYKFFFYSLHFIYLWKKLIKNVNRGRSPQVFALLVLWISQCKLIISCDIFWLILVSYESSFFLRLLFNWNRFIFLINHIFFLFSSFLRWVLSLLC